MESSKNYYNRKISAYQTSHRRAKNILELIPNLQGVKILDVGCGRGDFGSILRMRGAYVVGIDISQKAISLAKRKLNEVKRVDIENERLPFKKEFDIVLASEVIEHLFDPLEFLKKVRNILKNDGFLIVTTPNFLYWGNRIKFLLGQFQYTKSGIFDESHIHFYTYKSLKEDLAEAGYEIIKENHIFSTFKILDFFRNRLPALFAYQFVFKCQKNR